MPNPQRTSQATKRSTGRRRSTPKETPIESQAEQAPMESDSAPAASGGPIVPSVPTPAADLAGPDGAQPEASQDMIATRRTLPETRSSVTHKFAVAGHEGYLTIGLHADGKPGEIFIKMSKAGSTLSGMCQAFTRAFSLAMQFGLSLEDACRRFKGMRFEPMGMTQNPEIPEADSIIDYVARYLELTFCEVDRG